MHQALHARSNNFKLLLLGSLELHIHNHDGILEEKDWGYGWARCLQYMSNFPFYGYHYIRVSFRLQQLIWITNYFLFFFLLKFLLVWDSELSYKM